MFGNVGFTPHYSSDARKSIGAVIGSLNNLGYPLWGLTTLFLWMKRWKVETAVSA